MHLFGDHIVSYLHLPITTMSQTPAGPVIIGGGIIGLSTAYYLLTHPSRPTVTLIERVTPGHAASGRAMGMIGREWQPRHTLALSRLSWRCYEDLDRAYGGAEGWGWKNAEALGLELESGATLSRYRAVQKGEIEGGEGGVQWERVLDGFGRRSGRRVSAAGRHRTERSGIRASSARSSFNDVSRSA